MIIGFSRKTSPMELVMFVPISSAVMCLLFGLKLCQSRVHWKANFRK